MFPTTNIPLSRIVCNLVGRTRLKSRSPRNYSGVRYLKKFRFRKFTSKTKIAFGGRLYKYYDLHACVFERYSPYFVRTELKNRFSFDEKTSIVFGVGYRILIGGVL